MTQSPVEIFFSYCHRDEDLMKELVKHLSILKRPGVVQGWHDRQITPGQEWASEIDEHLNSAQVILLLISSDFLASEYCWGIETQRAMERHAAREACVIPVILRSVDWQGAPFGKLQSLPKDAKPITSWTNRDEAFLDVAQGIRKAIERLQPPQATPPQTATRTSSQQRRVQQEIESLQQVYDLLSQKISRLRNDLAIQAGSSIAFQLEKELEKAEAERSTIEQKLAKLES
jgi:hypothetical protein